MPTCRHKNLWGIVCRERWILVFVVSACNTHFLHFGLESGSLHAQSARSPVQTRDYSAALTQHPQNMFPFETLQRSIVTSAPVGGPQLRQWDVENAPLGKNH